ncbi:MAG: hypothetical protein ACXVAY_21640 [Mucilaginibacter sp.]
MKKAIYILGIFLSFHSFAWSSPKADTIYYLLNMAKIPANDRMWDIHGTDQYKYYTIQCPCLKFNGKPTFVSETSDKGQIMNKTQIKDFTLISLEALISRSKALLDNNIQPGAVSFFLIEPEAKNYVIRKVFPLNPEIHIVGAADMKESKFDNSAFTKSGLVTIAAKDVGKYINKSVITSCHIANTKVAPDNTTLLYVGADYPNQDFIILIESKNRRNFDLPDFRNRKKDIKVTGKVIEYKGQVAILISDENQLDKAPK